MSAGPSVNLLCSRGTSVNFLCVRGTICQILCQRNILSSSVNILCLHMTFRRFASTFCASMGLSVNFRQLSVHPRYHALNFCQWDIQSTFRSFAVPSVKFRQLSVYLQHLLSICHASVRPSVNFPCIRETFSQLLRVHGIFHQFLVWPRDLPSTFFATVGPSINIFCDRGTFRQPQSTFRVSVGPSANFPCGCGTFRQNSQWPEDHLSTFPASAALSINFCELTSILHASVGLFVNFRQLFVRPKTFCKLT